MRDAISLERCQNLHPSVRQEVIDTITKVEQGFPPNIKVRVVQGLRTIEEQDALYAQGRTKPGKKVTNARGGKSYHNYGTAIDFAIMYDHNGDGKFEILSWDISKDADKDGKSEWMEMVDAFKAIGWQWGGEWHSIKDYPHLEKSFGYTVSQLFAKYNAKDFIPGNKYLNLV